MFIDFKYKIILAATSLIVNHLTSSRVNYSVQRKSNMKKLYVLPKKQNAIIKATDIRTSVFTGSEWRG